MLNNNKLILMSKGFRRSIVGTNVMENGDPNEMLPESMMFDTEKEGPELKKKPIEEAIFFHNLC